MLKWGLPGRGVKSAKIPPTLLTSRTAGWPRSFVGLYTITLAWRRGLAKEGKQSV